MAWSRIALGTQARDPGVALMPSNDSAELTAGTNAKPGLLAGKVGIITGAASGIGRATAIAAVQAGAAAVVVADVDEEGGQATVQQVGGSDVAKFVRADVSDPRSVEQMVAHTLDTYGRLDFAHNNAGIEIGGNRLAEIPRNEWDRCIEVNLTGVWNCLRAEIPVMLENGGAIVNTSSGLGLSAVPRQGAYIAAKHGVIGLTRAAAVEYSSLGVRVNAVCPGVVRTPLFELAAERNPELLPLVQRLHPIGRLGQPEEIAAAVVWLCSDAASFVTGHAMAVDGGSLAM
jgi:NAD(P)-dependent dehydrogenase (short-subunit alcohol dehydrogenase family)